MTERQITLHRRAEAALRSLQKAEQSDVCKAIAFLSQWDRSTPHPPPKITKLKVGPEDLYSIRASQRLRLLFSYAAGGEITILDVVSHDAMRRYFAGGEA